MALTILTRDYGTANAGARVTVRTTNGAQPARLYATSGSKKPVSQDGTLILPATGILAVYVDAALEYTVSLLSKKGAVAQQETNVNPAAPQTVQSGVTAVTASRTLNAADHGRTLDVSTGVTLTIDAAVALPPAFRVDIVPTGTVTVAVTGDPTINGGTANVTRAAATAANTVFSIRSRAAAGAYVVTGA